MISCQKFHGQNFFSIFVRVSKLAVVKLSLTMIHVSRFQISFFCKSFGLEIWHSVTNIEMILWKKFHGKKPIFSPWEGIKVGNRESFFLANAEIRK